MVYCEIFLIFAEKYKTINHMLDKERGLYIAHCANGALSITGKMANRHGLIAGATGTGKTVTLQVMAETFCQAGVPCFMADMKGDLSGISQVGKMSGFIEKRLPEFGIENPEFQSCPVRFFDVFGEQGHPMRATISQMGPQLLSRLMQLNETQDGVLNIVFRIADERGLLLDDLKDLRSMLDWVSQHAKEYRTKYGTVTSMSIGSIQRALLQLENQGAEKFFGLPSFDIYDLLQTDASGKGIMNVLAADKLMLQPKLYSTFLLWLLSELYSTLPEVGDLPLPKLVFFFDEAHMLFTDTSKALLDKIEQVIRLIRSKGVGIYFITQSPTDIPETILGQLGNRVQHALRAYTPKDQKAVKTAADTFRANPAFKTDEAIMNLETGEALVSFLDEKGAPSIVERAKILFPLSQIGAITDGQRLDIIKQSRIYGKYDETKERESAFEVLIAEADRQLAEQEQQETEIDIPKPTAEAKAEKKKPGLLGKVGKAILTAITSTLAAILGTYVSDKVTGKKTKSRTSATGRVVKNATSAATRSVTRELTRDILGNLIK
jgi:DNA helicase HerA-like ATPase